MLTFDEFGSGVRDRLRFKTKELSDLELQQLWCALDTDESGYIESAEFGKFMGKPAFSAGQDERRKMMLRQKAHAPHAQLPAHSTHALRALCELYASSGRARPHVPHTCAPHTCLPDT